VTVAAFATAWFIHLLAAASPGPAVLLCARLAATEGMRVGFFYAVGVGIGGCFWALAAILGLSVLFEIAPGLLWGLKVGGGIFLLWLGLKMWRHAPEPLPEATPEVASRGAVSAIRLGVLTQLANPKTAVFFGAVFVSTVPANAPWGVIAALLAMVFANETLAISAFARAFSLGPMRRAYARLKTTIDRSFGGILAALGLKIAAT
jgi:threonine/homoserine/homoserine lactone efflux protein